MKQETVVNSEQVNGEHGVGKWMGALMVFMGAIFLMGTSGITIAGYSPSLLIGLVPMVWIGGAAYRRYQEDGRLTRRVLGIAVFAVRPSPTWPRWCGLRCLRPMAARPHCRWRFIHLVSRPPIVLALEWISPNRQEPGCMPGGPASTLGTPSSN